MDEIDAALHEWGRRWREAQPTPQGVGIPRGATRYSLWHRLPRLAVPAVGVLAVLLAAIGLTTRGPASGADWLRPAMAVTGTADLIDDADGTTQLCLGGSDLVRPPGCSSIAVPVEGVRWVDVPGAAEDRGVRYAWHVTVRGNWTGSVLQVVSVAAAPTTTFPAVANPCAGDEGSGAGLGTPNEEAALGALGAEVQGHPDQYGGEWRAASADGLGRMVVSVVGDPVAAEPRLRALYPYPLCITAAQFSETQLASTLDALGRSTADWTADIDDAHNRVKVSVAVLTGTIEQRLRPYADRVMISQILQPG